MSRSFLIVCGLAALSPLTLAWAAAAACYSTVPSQPEQLVSLTAYTVAVTHKVHFIQTAALQSSSSAKAFLVPGDQVIANLVQTRDQEGFRCVTYINPHVQNEQKGIYAAQATGWVPIAALTAAPAADKTLPGWFGIWHAPKAIIKSKAAGQQLRLDGEALWGDADSSYGPNIGSFSSQLTLPDGVDNIAFIGSAAASHQTSTKLIPTTSVVAHDKTSGECRVALRRLGSYMAVLDNDACGGANVSFSGVYRRQ